MRPALRLLLRLPLLLRLKQRPARAPALGWGAQLPVLICGERAREVLKVWRWGQCACPRQEHCTMHVRGVIGICMK